MVGACQEKNLSPDLEKRISAVRENVQITSRLVEHCHDLKKVSGLIYKKTSCGWLVGQDLVWMHNETHIACLRVRQAGCPWIESSRDPGNIPVRIPSQIRPYCAHCRGC